MKFLKNTNCSLSHRSYLKLSFDALLKALRPLVKELWPLECRQNFGFLQFSKIHNSQTNGPTSLKFGGATVGVHARGVHPIWGSGPGGLPVGEGQSHPHTRLDTFDFVSI